MDLTISSDIKQIELEINYHKQIAGQSIWEIGRRLNYVKENDLTHGGFIEWVKSLGMDRREAHKFMRVADELPNDSTFSHLGSSALYLVATLPEEERTKQHETSKGEVKTPDEMTVRELQELKKQIKAKDNTIKSQAETIESLSNAEPQIIEKEVVPSDYATLKTKVSNAEYYKQQNEDLKEEVKQIEQSYRALLSERSEVDEKSDRYDQLTSAINQAEGRLNQTQKMISNYKDLSDLLKQSNEFLSKASSIIYQDVSEIIESDGLARREFDFLVERLENFLSDLHDLTKKDYIEGVIINE